MKASAMKNHTTPTAALLAAIVALAPGAAAADASPAPGAKAQARATTEFVQAKRKRGSNTGLTLRYATPAVLKPGVPATVRIEVAGARSADARIELRSSSPNLSLTLDGREVREVALTPGAPRMLDLQALASADGTYHVSVTLHQGGRSAVSAVPLKAGAGASAMKSEGQVQTTPSGERVISMPAK
jgi:hypothetical protein